MNLGNANSFLVLYSILAATCGIFIAILFADTYSIKYYWCVPLPTLLLSFWLFIFSAEGVTDALDENDIQKYGAQFFLYNVAVILLLSGIYSMIYLKFVYQNFSSFQILIFLVFWGLMIFRWVSGCCQLLFNSEKEYQRYIESLINRKVKDEDRDWTKIFLWSRRKFHGKPSNT